MEVYASHLRLLCKGRKTTQEWTVVKIAIEKLSSVPETFKQMKSVEKRTSCLPPEGI